jgi:hypothetical protein
VTAPQFWQTNVDRALAMRIVSTISGNSGSEQVKPCGGFER